MTPPHEKLVQLITTFFTELQTNYKYKWVSIKKLRQKGKQTEDFEVSNKLYSS